jgi:putative flippase GtrA
MNSLLIKFVKFGIVGVTGVFVDFGMTWLLKEKLQINKYLANTTGFMCAVFSNYILNRIWTFQSQDSAVGLQFAKFFGVALVGLAINNALIYVFNGLRNVPFYYAKGIATAIVMLWNFGANYLFTFHNG